MDDEDTNLIGAPYQLADALLRNHEPNILEVEESLQDLT